MRNVALDLGAREISWCEVRGGEVIGRGVVHGIEELEPILGQQTPVARVGFEACREALHVHDWMAARGHVPFVFDTTRVRAIGVGSHGRKNDRMDAERLAVALERGYAAEAHVLSAQARKLREALEVHRALVGCRAELVRHARGLAAGRGVRLPPCAIDCFADNVAKLELPEPISVLIAALVSSVRTLQAQLADVDAQIASLLEDAEDPAVERLASVPGVSMMVAAAFIAVIDDPRRFRCASQVVAYLGLCPSERTTGGKQRLGAITKRGNGYARTTLVQAAWCVLRSRATRDPLVHWAHRVARRRGRMRAAVAVARRLARILWRMWRDGTYYDPQGIWRAAAQGAQDQVREANTVLRMAQRQSATKLRKQRRLIERARMATGSA